MKVWAPPFVALRARPSGTSAAGYGQSLSARWSSLHDSLDDSAFSVGVGVSRAVSREPAVGTISVALERTLIAKPLQIFVRQVQQTAEDRVVVLADLCRGGDATGCA